MTIATDNATLAATRPAQAIRMRENVILNRADAALGNYVRASSRLREIGFPPDERMPILARAVVARAYAELEAMGSLPAVTVTIRRDGAAVVVGIEEG